MIIKKTIYVETVEILVLGSSRWRKVGLEAEISDEDDVVKESGELKKIVDKIHLANNVEADILQPFSKGELVNHPGREAFYKKLQKCKTINELNKFNKEGKGMRDIWIERLKQLQEK